MSAPTHAGRICRLSGTFVEMLRRIVDISGYTQTAGAGPAGEATTETVAPTRILDGFGAFGPPPSTAKPLKADYRDRATLDHPPGFYGPPDGPLAVNTLAAADRIAALDTSSLRARHAAYRSAEPRDLRGWLLSGALGLFLLDALVVAFLGAGIAGLLRRRRAVTAAAVAADVPRRHAAVRAGLRPRRTTKRTSRRCRRPASPMSSPATPTWIRSCRPAWPG